MKRVLLFLLVLTFSSCVNVSSLDRDLINMDPVELLDYSKKIYGLDRSKSGNENDERVRLMTIKLILDGLLFPENINWENLEFQDSNFKKRLRTRSQKLSESKDFYWVQLSYLEVKRNPNISDDELEKIKTKGSREIPCLGKEEDVKLLENNRISKFSDVSFNIQSVKYVGNCTYQVLSSVSDLRYMKDYDLKIDYIFDSSSKTFSNNNGEILNEELSVSESDVKESLDRFLEENRLIHGTLGGMRYYPNLSNPERGLYSYYGTICYGSNKYECENESVYVTTTDFGRTWSVDF